MTLKEKVELVIERLYPGKRISRPQKIHQLALRLRRYDIDVARFGSGGRNVEKFNSMFKALYPIAKSVDVDLLDDDVKTPEEIEEDVSQELSKRSRATLARRKERHKKTNRGHLPKGGITGT